MEKAKNIFSKFVSELVTWTEQGAIPETGDQDTSYYLELQRKRLKKQNVALRYKLNLRGGVVDQVRGRSWTDKKYTNTMCFQGFDKETSVWSEGKCLFSKRDSENVYGIVTELNESDVSGDEMYTCPNCGAISPVKELLNGCAYCGTRFSMTDLFPKITNYFFLHDYATGKTDVKKKVLKGLVVGFVIGLIIGLLVFLGMNLLADMSIVSPEKRMITRLSFLVIGGVVGIVTGIISIPVGILGGAVIDSMKISPILSKISGTKEKIKSLFRDRDPYFSYDYFMGQVISMVKTMVFSDDKANLAIYQGNAGSIDCSDIIDVAYRGGIACTNVKVEGDYCYMDIEVFVKNTCIITNKVSEKDESFLMRIAKNISHPTELGFSIHKVQCPNCAASFDATRIQHCPSCSSKYDLKEEDWVVLDFRRKQSK